MKAWKMAACLLLLAVMICGCVVLGRGAEVSAKEPSEQEQQEGAENNENIPEDGAGESVTPPPEESVGGSVTVEKIYSDGLYYRSNGDGTCAVAGLGSCTSAVVVIPPCSPAGDRVTEILPYAFSGSIVGAIEIPTTVEVLSAASFKGCARLAYLCVATGNKSFMAYDGALYSADGKTLLYCPAANIATELLLHPALTRVAAGAFADCTGLGSVVFSGSVSAWQSVIVGDENEALYAASLSFGRTQV